MMPRLEVVLRDLETLVKEMAKIGIELNAAKCEIVVMNVEDQASRQTIVKIFQNLATLDRLSLLGSCIFDSNVEADIDNLQLQLSVLCERVNKLSSHEALLLIKDTLFIQKMMYNLRTAPFLDIGRSWQKWTRR
ncbi:hypothetical protein ACOME3_007221 [Neoechinorhynchus agilis]